MRKTKIRRFKIRKDFLPISKPSLGKEEIKAVTDVIKKGWITTGPKTFEFEKNFKKFIGAKHAVAMSSCTDALHIALVVLGVGRGDEVILSPMTFVSQANVIVHVGAKPVFADIKEDTLNIDPCEIEKRITKKTKVIMLTHFAGQPCERDKIKRIAKKHKIKIIEDAAHALGSEWRGKKIGSDPDTISCFSFYPIKNITTADGGMLTTGNKNIAEKVRTLSLHGMSTGAWKRYSTKASWRYDVKFPGYKANMTDLLAALGVTQLKKIKKFDKNRQKIANYYTKELSKIDGIRIPTLIKGIKHSRQIFPIMINSRKLGITRDRLIEELKKYNIGTSVHFQPVYTFSFYKKFDIERKFKVSAYVSKNILSIPIFPTMSLKDCASIIQAILKITDIPV